MDEFSIAVRAAEVGDLELITQFLKPFMNGKQLLPRTSDELQLLLKHGFIAEHAGRVVGFAAIEIYSRKMAEVQCLAVDEMFQRRGIGRDLVARCVERAKSLNVIELMAISSSEELFRACGFDYSLPNQKRALFIQPGEAFREAVTGASLDSRTEVSAKPAPLEARVPENFEDDDSGLPEPA